MKKSYQIMIYIIVLVGILSCSTTKNVEMNKNPLIKTKKVVSYHPESKKDILSREEALTTMDYKIETYSKLKHIISRINYDKNDKVKSGTNYIVNKYGDITESVYSSTPQIRYESNAIIETSLTDIVNKNEYVYNSKGQLISEDVNNITAKYQIKKTHFYVNGLLDKTTSKKSNRGKQTIQKTFYNYNHFNKIDSMLVYKDEALYLKNLTKYDMDSIKEEFVSYKFSDDIITYTHTEKYDKKGNVIFLLKERGNDQYINVSSKYDNDGLVVNELYKRNDTPEMAITYKYELDKFNNITTTKKFIDGTITFIQEVKYEYY